MTPSSTPPAHTATSELPADPRGQLLLRIARRADELVRETRRSPGLNRVCWLLAEHETIVRDMAGLDGEGRSLSAS